MNNKYIFTSERLGFRNWTTDDLIEFTAMNQDKEVMKFFPKLLTENDTLTFIERLQNDYYEHLYCYFATEILSTGEFIGFVGLGKQSYKTKYTPAIDIGWRLKRSAWGNGYATEGAKKCLEYAFINLKINSIISVCTEKNKNSEKVMQKIGMQKIGFFNHPKLKDYPKLEKCICYKIVRV